MRKIVKVINGFGARSFWTGFGSPINLAGNIDYTHKVNNARETDSVAIRGDWEMIGTDFREAMKQKF